MAEAEAEAEAEAVVDVADVFRLGSDARMESRSVRGPSPGAVQFRRGAFMPFTARAWWQSVVPPAL